jgi:hypothetical protein
MHNGYGNWQCPWDINSGMHMKKHDHNSHGFQARKSNA